MHGGFPKSRGRGPHLWSAPEPEVVVLRGAIGLACVCLCPALCSESFLVMFLSYLLSPGGEDSVGGF